MFSYEDKEKALRIVYDIMQHPISSFFIDTPSDQCLTSLYQKVQNNVIVSLSQFQHEIDSVLSTTDPIYQEDDYFKIAVSYIKKTFRKNIEKNFTKTISLWSKRVAHLEQKIEKLNMENPIESKYPKLEFAFDQKLSSQLLNEREYSTFMKAVNLIKDQGDMEELYKIVNTMQPELTFNGTITKIPVLKLKSQTLKTLIKKVREIFKEKKITYPS